MPKVQSAHGFTSSRSAHAHLFAGVLLIDVVDKLPVLLGISVFSAAVELVPGGEGGKQVLTHITTPIYVTADYSYFPSIDFSVDDNISVPVAAAIATAILL